MAEAESNRQSAPIRALCLVTRSEAFRDLAQRAGSFDEGIKFEFVNSPDSVLELLEHGLSECVILDPGKEVSDSLELVRSVRAKSDVPIILYVTLEDLELAPEARVAGVNEIIIEEMAFKNVEAFLSVIKRSVADWWEARRKAVTIDVLHVLG
ncbi:MAG: hypothetical protein JSV27_09800, partial [Candidatus Bathyarchaeota archaeon]